MEVPWKKPIDPERPVSMHTRLAPETQEDAASLATPEEVTTVKEDNAVPGPQPSVLNGLTGRGILSV